MLHMGLVRGKRLATPVRSSNSFHSAESPQKTIAPHLAFNPRGSLEHKRFVHLVLVHGACPPSCRRLASLQPDLLLYMYAVAGLLNQHNFVTLLPGEMADWPISARLRAGARAQPMIGRAEGT